MAAEQALEVREKKELASKEEKTIPARFYVPATDIHETQDSLLVMMEVPGVEKKDIDIHVENDVVRIEGRIDPKKYEGLEPAPRLDRIVELRGLETSPSLLPAGGVEVRHLDHWLQRTAQLGGGAGVGDDVRDVPAAHSFGLARQLGQVDLSSGGNVAKVDLEDGLAERLIVLVKRTIDEDRRVVRNFLQVLTLRRIRIPSVTKALSNAAILTVDIQLGTRLAGLGPGDFYRFALGRINRACPRCPGSQNAPSVTRWHDVLALA